MQLRSIKTARYLHLFGAGVREMPVYILGCSGGEDFGAEAGFATHPNNNLEAEALTDHSLPHAAPLQAWSMPLG